MVRPLISDEEFNKLKERYMACLNENWAKGQGLTSNSFNAVGTNITALIEIMNLLRLKESSERLERSSRILNCLTWALVSLTIILAILTGLSVAHYF